jgi:hypothetical protein
MLFVRAVREPYPIQHLKNLSSRLVFYFRGSILFSWQQQKENAMQQPQQQQKDVWTR